jgi:hypothetical protein
VSSLSRETKVFTVLAISMMAGVIVLKLLGNNPPSAGAFCLSHYYRLEPVEKVILSRAVKSPDCWNRIEIYYSGTKSGSIEQLASLGGLASPTDINCHFIICNGLGGGDGQIQPTERWQRQWSVIPGPTRYGSEQTIYICVIADGKTTHPTDFQIKRTEILVEKLSGKFSILPASIYYPSDWQ